jgi:hypothetical protein
MNPPTTQATRSATKPGAVPFVPLPACQTQTWCTYRRRCSGLCTATATCRACGRQLLGERTICARCAGLPVG